MHDTTLTNGITIPAVVLSLADRCPKLNEALAAMRDVRRLPYDIRVALQAALRSLAGRSRAWRRLSSEGWA